LILIEDAGEIATVLGCGFVRLHDASAAGAQHRANLQDHLLDLTESAMESVATTLVREAKFDTTGFATGQSFSSGTSQSAGRASPVW
jgi:hypothetical protein